MKKMTSRPVNASAKRYLDMTKDGIAILHGYLQRMQLDFRVGPSHISLFMAIFYHHIQNDHLPVCYLGTELMRHSKLSSRTYYKCLRELDKYGYIKYRPSFDPAFGSIVSLKELQGA